MYEFYAKLYLRLSLSALSVVIYLQMIYCCTDLFPDQVISFLFGFGLSILKANFLTPNPSKCKYIMILSSSLTDRNHIK